MHRIKRHFIKACFIQNGRSSPMLSPYNISNKKLSHLQDSFALVENSMVRLVRSLNRELDHYKNNN